MYEGKCLPQQSTNSNMTKTEGYNLLEDFMEIHGLLSKGWRPKIVDDRSRGGYCHWERKILAISVHHLSSPEDKIVDTILHEIAHALVGPYVKQHGEIWRRKALEIGCSGHRCMRMQTPYKYTGFCKNCKRESKANRRTNKACGHCCKEYNNNRYSEKFKIIWK